MKTFHEYSQQYGGVVNFYNAYLDTFTAEQRAEARDHMDLKALASYASLRTVDRAAAVAIYDSRCICPKCSGLPSPWWGIFDKAAWLGLSIAVVILLLRLNQ